MGKLLELPVKQVKKRRVKKAKWHGLALEFVLLVAAIVVADVISHIIFNF